MDYTTINESESIQDTLEKLEQNVKQGRIYTLDFSWGRNGGHILIVERDDDGDLFLYDPQTSKVRYGEIAAGYISRADFSREITMLDVTDLELDRWVAENILREAE